MLIEKDVQKILNQLAIGDSLKVAFDGLDIMVRFIDDSSKVSLSTLVYEGGNYIPASVRRCLSQSLIFHPSIRTYFTIDEQQFQIKLNYLGHAETLTHDHFKDLLEEFGLIAEKWRLHLDEHDRGDLVYVRVK